MIVKYIKLFPDQGMADSLYLPQITKKNQKIKNDKDKFSYLEYLITKKIPYFSKSNLSFLKIKKVNFSCEC